MVDKLSEELVDNVLSTINLRQTEICLFKKILPRQFRLFLTDPKAN